MTKFMYYLWRALEVDNGTEVERDETQAKDKYDLIEIVENSFEHRGISRKHIIVEILKESDTPIITETLK